MAYFLNIIQSASASLIGESNKSAQTSNPRGGIRFWPLNEEPVPPGWFKAGKILYNPMAVLGRGCEGTVVYR
jgi:hypothetical protein